MHKCAEVGRRLAGRAVHGLPEGLALVPVRHDPEDGLAVAVQVLAARAAGPGDERRAAEQQELHGAPGHQLGAVGYADGDAGDHDHT